MAEEERPLEVTAMVPMTRLRSTKNTAGVNQLRREVQIEGITSSSIFFGLICWRGLRREEKVREELRGDEGIGLIKS